MCNLNEIIKSMKSKEKEIEQLEAKLEKYLDEKFLKKLLQRTKFRINFNKEIFYIMGTYGQKISVPMVPIISSVYCIYKVGKVCCAMINNIHEEELRIGFIQSKTGKIKKN